MFEISMFPDNIPTPEPKLSAWLLGGVMHFIHLCVRISQDRRSAEEDLPWADPYESSGSSSWFDWVCYFLSKFLFMSDLSSLDPSCDHHSGSIVILRNLQIIHAL